MDEDLKTSAWRQRLAKLRLEQADWRVHWKEIVENMLPRRGRYLNGDDITQDNDGRKKHQKIINSTAGGSLRTLSSGLIGGLCSPSRPWFSLVLPDDDLSEYTPVREWLHKVRDSMLTVFARSNFYGSIHSLFYELGGFGTGAMMIEEDMRFIIRCRPFTIGEYCLAVDSNYRPDSLYRQFSMTACQIRDRFGKGSDKMQGLIPDVVNALKNKNPDQRFEIVHVLEQAKYVDGSKADYRGMKFASVYFPLSCGDENFVFQQGGYKSIPFVAPRWDVTGVDTYGYSPAMDALGDVKMLQKMEEKKLKALDKLVDPPMNAPTSMRQIGGTIVAGGVNYVDTQQGGQSFTPAYQVNPNMQQIAFEMERVEMRVKEAFYNNLFLSVLNEEKQMTAAEVAKRYEEKLLVLGPVFERLQSECMDPSIDRVFNIMNDLQLFPPAPKELPAGMELKVQYVSLLAQAQQMIQTTAIQQLVMFAGQMAPIFPDAVDKIDAHEIIDQMATMTGVPPKVIRSDDAIAQIQAQKQKQQQLMQAAAMAKPAADAAGAVNSLATAPRNGTSTVLDTLLQGVGAPPPAP